MNWSYIVSGISIVNDIIYADNRRTAGLLGGCCVFAYSGIRLLTEAVLPVTSCGSDFTDYFGDYWKHNRIPSDGVYHSMPFIILRSRQRIVMLLTRNSSLFSLLR